MVVTMIKGVRWWQQVSINVGGCKTRATVNGVENGWAMKEGVTQ